MVNRMITPATQSAQRVFKLIISVLSVSIGFNANAAEKDYYKLTTVPSRRI